jgi:hypothetical protein
MALNANTRISANRKNLSTTVLFTGTGSIVIAGNSTVSDIATGDEVITSATITQLWVGSPSGNSSYWTIARGSNTVAVWDSSGYFDYAGNGNALTLDKSANLTVTLTGSGAGTLLIELQKEGTFPSTYYT